MAKKIKMESVRPNNTRFEECNNEGKFLKELHENHMTWEVKGKIGILSHEPSGYSVSTEADGRTTPAYKRYLIQKLLGKLKESY